MDAHDPFAFEPVRIRIPALGAPAALAAPTPTYVPPEPAPVPDAAPLAAPKRKPKRGRGIFVVAALVAAWFGMTWLAVHRGRSTAEQPLEPVWKSVEDRVVVEVPSEETPSADVLAGQAPSAEAVAPTGPAVVSDLAAVTPPTGVSLAEATPANPSSWPRTGPALGAPEVVAPPADSPYPRTDAEALTASRPVAEFEGTIRSPQFRAQHEHHGQGLY